jgi:uncharacterized RDD family membrane protein YckC
MPYGPAVTAVDHVRYALDTHVTGRRAVATWVDLFIVRLAYQLVAMALHLPVNLLGQLERAGTNGDAASRVAHGFPELGVYCLLAGVYYVVFESIWGRTIGKLLTGIRVVTESGTRAGPGRILARTALRLLDGLGGYLLGFLVAMTSHRRQRLGDITAGTLFVRIQRPQ